MNLSKMEYLQRLSKGILKRLKKAYPDMVIEDLEDVVQNGMLKYLEREGNLDAITPQWLYLTCSRMIIDKHRRSGKVILADVELTPSNDESTIYVDINLDSKREDIKKLAQQFAYPDQD